MEAVVTFIAAYADWFALATSASCAWFMGSKKWWAPWIGCTGQGFWFALAFATGRYGLLINTVIFTFIGFRNAVKWTREHRERQALLRKLAGQGGYDALAPHTGTRAEALELPHG